MKLLSSIALSLVLLSVPAAAQWQTPNHSVPLGRGAGVTGFGNVAPGTAGVPLISNGAASDPAFAPLNLGGAGVTGQLPNANLVNPSTTVNGQTCTLGAACTVPLPFQPVFNIKSAPYNARCNYGFKADIAMGTGSTTATSATGWAVGDVGKYIIVQGAGAAGVTLVTTIASFTDATHVVLANANAFGAPIAGKNAEFGNDDAAAINAAIAAAVAAGGGTVYLPAGNPCLVSQINMTNITQGVTLKGEGITSSRLMPLQTATYSTSAGHVIDLSGAAQVILQDFQLGAFNGLAIAATGVFMGQVPSNAANRIRMERIYLSGQYSGATLYVYGVPSWDCISSDFYNYFPGAGSRGAAYFTNTNAFSYTSSFTTLMTPGGSSTSDIHFFDTEFHKFAGAGADNWVMRFDATTNIAFYGGVISGGASAYGFYDGANLHISYFNMTFETEGQPVMPTNAHFKASGTVTDLSDVGSSYIISGAKFNPAAATSNLVTNAQ